MKETLLNKEEEQEIRKLLEIIFTHISKNLNPAPEHQIKKI